MFNPELVTFMKSFLMRKSKITISHDHYADLLVLSSALIHAHRFMMATTSASTFMRLDAFLQERGISIGTADQICCKACHKHPCPAELAKQEQKKSGDTQGIVVRIDREKAKTMVEIKDA